MARSRVVLPVPLRPTRPYLRPYAIVTVASCTTMSCVYVQALSFVATLPLSRAPAIEKCNIFVQLSLVIFNNLAASEELQLAVQLVLFGQLAVGLQCFYTLSGCRTILELFNFATKLSARTVYYCPMIPSMINHSKSLYWFTCQQTCILHCNSTSTYSCTLYWCV